MLERTLDDRHHALARFKSNVVTSCGVLVTRDIASRNKRVSYVTIVTMIPRNDTPLSAARRDAAHIVVIRVGGLSLSLSSLLEQRNSRSAKTRGGREREREKTEASRVITRRANIPEIFTPRATREGGKSARDRAI